MARATRKSKEVSSTIVEEKVSKKPKVDRKRKSNEVDKDDEDVTIDMTEVARERHAEWAKLVLGKIDSKSPGKRVNSTSSQETITIVETKATTKAESIPTAPKRGKGKGALITNMSKAKSILSEDSSKSEAAEIILPSNNDKNDNQNKSIATTSRVKSKSASPTRTPTTKTNSKKYKETPAAPKVNANEDTNKSIIKHHGGDVKVVMIISVLITFIVLLYQKYISAGGNASISNLIQGNFHLAVWTFIILNIALYHVFG